MITIMRKAGIVIACVGLSISLAACSSNKAANTSIHTPSQLAAALRTTDRQVRAHRAASYTLYNLQGYVRYTDQVQVSGLDVRASITAAYKKVTDTLQVQADAANAYVKGPLPLVVIVTGIPVAKLPKSSTVWLRVPNHGATKTAYKRLVGGFSTSVLSSYIAMDKPVLRQFSKKSHIAIIQGLPAFLVKSYSAHIGARCIIEINLAHKNLPMVFALQDNTPQNNYDAKIMFHKWSGHVSGIVPQHYITIS